jgi:hypothetical protein
MQEKLTVFHAKKESRKIPFSPFDDNTFVFETYTTTSHLQMYNVMVSNFILAIPLHNLDKPIRTFRRKANLEQYQHTSNNYIILDLDNVRSESSKQNILDYFKDFKVILGASRSHNGINNFRMKGVLFTESIPLEDIKLAMSQIHHDLQDWCDVDESVGRKVSYNAPIMKNDIFLNNEDGILFKFTKKEAQQHIKDVKEEYITKKIESYTEIPIGDIGKDIEADTMEKLCLKVFQTMGFQAIKNNPNKSISFKHPNENKSPGGYFWFSESPYTMHHANSTKTLNIFDAVRKLPLARELMKKEINYDAEFLEFNTDTTVITVNEKYLEVTDEIDTMVQNFLSQEGGLLSIRSAMGTGKSTVIKHVIEECHDEDMRVLIVTNRISVAVDFGKKYNMKVYNQDHYEINDSLICQYDSLWKYNIKSFDIVIMDEFISLMMHSRSNLNNSSINIGKFFGCFNKKLVIADAFLTGYENFLLSNKENNINLIDNTYRDPTTLYSYSDFNYFVNSVLYHTQKHKITVSATSLNFINSLSMLLQKRGLKVITLTADTPDSTKKLVYELFEKEDHDKWDVLIYSPTLTVGVSNLNNVDYHFHYDSSMSTDAISSIQMIKRTRKTKEIHMFIKDKINYLKTSYNDIRDEYMGNMGKNIEHNYLFAIDDYGEAKLSKVGKSAIKIDTFKNILEFNHKEAMFWLMKYHFLNEPRVIDTTFSSNVLSKYQSQVRLDKNSVLINKVDQFLLLNDIEKTALLMDVDTDKVLRTLVEIDDEIKDGTCSDVKSKILECSLNDKNFIRKCKYYKVTFNFTKRIWENSDVQHLVSQAVMHGKNDDLQFYNSLIAYGQIEIFEEYLPKHINKNRHLKYILDRCGYSVTRLNDPGVVGHRGFMVDKNVKELHGFIE